MRKTCGKDAGPPLTRASGASERFVRSLSSSIPAKGPAALPMRGDQVGLLGRVPHCGMAASRCYDATVAKTRTTVTIDEKVLTAVRVRAARTGKGDSEVIEEALRRELGLDLLDRLWARNDLDEDQAMALAIEAQHAARRTHR